MGAELSIPANIFDEMAGMKDTTPPVSQTSQENVESKQKTSEIHTGRLNQSAHAYFSKIHNDFINSILVVINKLRSFFKKPNSGFSFKKLKRFIPFVKSDEDDEEDKEKSSLLSKIWELIKGAFKLIWKLVKWVFKQIFKQIVKRVLKPLFSKAWNAIKGIFSKGKGAEVAKKNSILDRVLEKPKRLWMKIKEKIKKFINKIKNVVQRVVTKIKGLINKLTSPFRKVKELVKNIFNKFKQYAKNVINTIKRRLRALVRSIKKAAKKVLRLLKKQLKKMQKVIFKAMRKILASIWKIVKKLFFKGKPLAKLFVGEPKAQSMADPKLSKKDNKMNLKIKGPKKKESFIMKAVKKIFKKFIKPIAKIIKKVFGKLIKKILKTIVKMVVRFIAAQVIGSLLPGIGNAIAMAACMAMMVSEAIGMVDFISGIGSDISQISQEMSEVEPEEPDEADDDNFSGSLDGESGAAIGVMTLDQMKATIDQLEKEGKTNTQEYLNRKTDYLNSLAREYRNNGDAETAAMIEASIKYGRVPRSGNLEIGEGMTEGGLQNLNIKELQEEIRRNRLERAKVKYENKKENVFDDSEIDTLLKGEEDGGPMWTSIWREIMWFIKLRQPERLEQERYQKICSEIISPHLQPQVLEYNIAPPWRLETDEEKNQRIANSESVLYAENSEYVDYKNDDYEDNPKFKDVISKASKYKFNTAKAVEPYVSVKTKEINAQRVKHNKFLQCLETIVTTRKITERNKVFKPMALIPEPTI